MQIIAGPRQSLPPKTWEALSAYVRRVIEMQLPRATVCELGVEFDEFDTDAAMYAVLLDDQERVVACARLLRTTRPHVIGLRYRSHFEAPPPNGANIWEVSYFYARGPIGASERSALQRPREALELLSGVITFSQHLSAQQLLFRASQRAIAMIQRLGLEVEILSARSVWVRGRRYEIARLFVPQTSSHWSRPTTSQ